MSFPVSMRFAYAALLCLVATSMPAGAEHPAAHNTAQARPLAAAAQDDADGSGGLPGGSGACGTDGSPCADPHTPVFSSTGGDVPAAPPAPEPPSPVRAAEPGPCAASPAPPDCDDPTPLPPGAQPVAPAGDHPEASNLGVTRAAVSSAAGLTVTAAEWRFERLLEIGVRAPSVKEPTRFRVLLPVGYPAQPGRRYPVLYLLPGGDADFRYWSDTADVARLVGDTPLIVVMPDPVHSSTQLHFTRLVPWVDANFRTHAGRAVAGPTTGGVAATTSPDLFTVATVLPADVNLPDELGRELPRIMAAITQQPPP